MGLKVPNFNLVLKRRWLLCIIAVFLTHPVLGANQITTCVQWRNAIGLWVGEPTGTRTKGAPVLKMFKKRGKKKRKKRKNERIQKYN